MSFSFLKNFIKVEGGQAADKLTAALVNASPETATKAELATMEEDLDNAGRVITRLYTELGELQRRFDASNTRYSELVATAEVLQSQMDDPYLSAERRTSISGSLDNLLKKIESEVPELDRDRHDIDATESFLRDAEAAYRDKSQALLTAKTSLDHAKLDMQHAHLEEERAQHRADDARVLAGLKTTPSSGLTTALDAMTKSAQEARERASASNMKAEVLSTPTDNDDENIRAAMEQAKGHPSEKSLADRLKSLKR